MDASNIVDFPAKDGLIRRKEPRTRVFKAGTVAINNKSSTISCTIRNLSDGGARLKVQGLFRPPHEFDLLVPADDWEAGCEVVWRNGNELGVRFVTDRVRIKHAGGSGPAGRVF